jgi:hypothetical protein
MASDSSVLLTVLVTSAFWLSLYTAYDKTSRSLKPSLLLDVFLLRRGTLWSLLELNKALALVALTLLSLAYLPGFTAQRQPLLKLSLGMVVAHSSLSFNTLYGTKLWPKIQRLPHVGLPRLGADGVEAVKLTGIMLGNAATTTLAAGLLGYLSPKQLCFGVLGLGMAHFGAMEIDFRGVLQVRPIAKLSAPLALLAVLAYSLAG